MTQSYRNLIASGIVLQLAMLDVYFTLKAGSGGGAWWKFILYALFFAVMHFPARGWRVLSPFHLWQQNRMTGDSMLWQKSWWETRWGILPFMGVMLLFAVWRLPLEQTDLPQWFSSLQEIAPRWSEDSRSLLPLLNSYQGYVWYNWFKLLLLIMWPMYAVAGGATLAAASCPWIAGAPGASGLFTFSLPVSRRRVLLTHAALVAVEMAFVALVPSLIFPIVLRLIGADVSFGSTVVHALLLTLGGTVFISLTFLMTAVLNSQIKAMAIGIAIVSALRFPFRPLEEIPWWNVYHVMSGETYFRYGKIPWLGLLASLALSALMMLTAVRIYERRDF